MDRAGIGSTPADLLDRIDGARNVLLDLHSTGVGEPATCTRLLQRDPPSHADLIQISYTRPPASCVDAWLAGTPQLPDRHLVVAVGDRASPPDDPQELATDPTVETVADPRDLTSLGVVLTDTLDRWGGSSNQLAVCFDSLTALLRFADGNRVFRFLHVLTGHFAHAEAVAHYHIDSTAHGPRTVNALRPLFDAVVSWEDDAGWQIHTR